MNHTDNPACATCPVAARAAGCGYLVARTPCQHPEWRDAWAAAEEWDKRRQSQELCDLENAVEMEESDG